MNDDYVGFLHFNLILQKKNKKIKTEKEKTGKHVINFKKLMILLQMK